MKRFLQKFIPLVFLLVPSGAYSQAPLTGFSLSPEGFPFTFDSLPQFFTEVTQNCPGSVIYGSARWYDSASAAGNVPAVAGLISGSTPTPYNYTSMVTLGWATYPSTLYLDPQGGANNWTNAATRSLYLQTLASTADQNPAYLFVGNEVNFYIETDSLDYLNWVSFYHEAYDTIKAHSPQTKVGTVFNYEHLSGNGDNLNPIPWTAPHWSALTLIDTAKMDVVAVNTYPFLQYLDVNSVPNNYLQPFFDTVGNKPVVITETGWPADDFGLAPWGASPAEQSAYVNKLFTMISGQNVEAVNWLFLHYMMDYNQTIEDAVFCSISMYDSTGVAYPAYALWQSHCAITAAPEIPAAGNEITIAPNPFSHTATITLSENSSGVNQFFLFDALGKKVRTSSFTGQSATCARENLSPGFYFYRVTDENGKLLGKGKLVIE
ncbi:MAG: hypothetical protein FD123_529 [Bacteroidetes bacterium]|nr:MAG: hypothetical protein FD123_529 [Bacteroidota bacterium]